MIVGSFKDLTFMLIVVANTAIGIAQEIRSKQTLDKLKLMKMPKCHVIRDGREKEVAVEDLVLDDVIVLQGREARYRPTRRSLTAASRSTRR